MKRTLVCVLMAAWSLGSGDQTVNQPVGDMHAMKGDPVTLDCSYESSGSNDYIFWYKQNGQAAPEFILSRFKIGQGKTERRFENRFSCSINATAHRAPLVIQDVQLNDSAVYYCALQPTIGTSKLLFGSGTRLTVEDQEDWEPSFYKLDKLEGNVTACLATGFSRQNAMETAGKGDVFQGSHAVRILGDSLYNQVTLLSAEHADSCEKAGDSGPGWCQGALAPDEKVNLVSLTVLVLRLVFAKTLAINGVMTLRLWLAVPQ
ncbi:T cell receptor alpha chain MC.7.G5-like [Dunckerocampus dactyliophorus]|uniref:T cell receptor alpha chain MC.7.G5-like n=1 Tax=Dunckerocampus dactyliophorus TaxID=161453 RepID=UPI0024070D6E|nr:T cell receptor alpha chain MC.7.G5-like [Dunckerocampus dactyliophorus]